MYNLYDNEWQFKTISAFSLLIANFRQFFQPGKVNGNKTKENQHFLGAATFLCDDACKFVLKNDTLWQNGRTSDGDGVRREREHGLVRDPVYPMAAPRAICDSMLLWLEVLRRSEANKRLKMRLICQKWGQLRNEVAFLLTVFAHFKTRPDMYFNFFEYISQFVTRVGREMFEKRDN